MRQSSGVDVSIPMGKGIPFSKRIHSCIKAKETKLMNIRFPFTKRTVYSPPQSMELQDFSQNVASIPLDPSPPGMLYLSSAIHSHELRCNREGIWEAMV